MEITAFCIAQLHVYINRIGSFCFYGQSLHCLDHLYTCALIRYAEFLFDARSFIDHVLHLPILHFQRPEYVDSTDLARRRGQIGSHVRGFAMHCTLPVTSVS